MATSPNAPQPRAALPRYIPERRSSLPALTGVAQTDRALESLARLLAEITVSCGACVEYTAEAVQVQVEPTPDRPRAPKAGRKCTLSQRR